MAIEEIRQIPTKLSAMAAPEADYKAASKSKDTEETEYGFWDFLDLINPLQHIPVVNTIYREVTGDTIKPEMKLAGGAALGGVFGFVSSLADVIFEQETGKDIGSTMVAAVFGDDDKDVPVQVAKAEPIQHTEPSIHDVKPHAFMNEMTSKISALDTQRAQVLALYGASTPPERASRAYQQADMRAYLQQSSMNATF
ncbi:MAG: hypothetical protein J0M34_07370 [Alphaproteobacteria bacterium]|nr:hypothetical protein [Alphaproteobacteria bacterium]